MLLQKCAFGCSLQIAQAIAGMDFVEEAEMIGEGLRQSRVSCGDKGNSASLESLLLEKIEDLFPIGQARGIELNAASKFALGEGLSVEEPEG